SKKPLRLRKPTSRQSWTNISIVSRWSRLLRVTFVPCFGSRIQRPIQKAVEGFPHRLQVVTRIVLEETLSNKRRDLGFAEFNRHAAQSVSPPFAMPAHAERSRR